ncbi:hypothetical protein GCM10007887_08350 [Methylobacterium haplocladii]|uniref:Uncharacterized protein n=1 Tax=Methylobacterium haplocladii TaxID=1176176 RepID=A0A512IR13_9HYPH|nr:hypothetical protein MHA02_25180 [Methylobacterium haplocladii]GLS58179.1 hypothetical protein GCM10007887_08350 [Methylobacterium haplocladii]
MSSIRAVLSSIRASWSPTAEPAGAGALGATAGTDLSAGAGWDDEIAVGAVDAVGAGEDGMKLSPAGLV